MTVGREESSPVTLNAHEDTAIADIPTPDKSELQAAEQMVKALGGKENIKSLDNCVTRLRLTIADMGLIDEVAIKIAGGIAVVKLDRSSPRCTGSYKCTLRAARNYAARHFRITNTELQAGSYVKQTLYLPGTFPDGERQYRILSTHFRLR